MARRTFFSFQHTPDNWRAAHVRNIGVVAGNRPVSNNGWETVTKGGHTAIEKWISGQMHRCSCAVVLVGSNTVFRKWIDYEIIRSWNEKMGVVGIHIHGLKNLDGKTSKQVATRLPTSTTEASERSYRRS